MSNDELNKARELARELLLDLDALEQTVELHEYGWVISRVTKCLERARLFSTMPSESSRCSRRVEK